MRNTNEQTVMTWVISSTEVDGNKVELLKQFKFLEKYNIVYTYHTLFPIFNNSDGSSPSGI